FEAAAIIMMVLDNEGIVSQINEKGCEILGYKKEEITGKNWFDNFVPDRLRQEVGLEFHRLVNGEEGLFGYYENFVIANGGKEKLIAWNNTVLRDSSGKVASVLSSGEDITERREAERQIIMFRRFADGAGQGFGMAALDGKIIYLNNTLLNIFAEDIPEEVLKKNIRDYYPKEWHERLEKEVLPSVLKEGQWTGESKIISCQGKVVPVLEHIFCIRKATGEPECLANIITDITEQKKIEEILRFNEERYRTLFEGLQDAIFIADPQTRMLTDCNEKALEMTGRARQEIRSMRADELHPEDVREATMEVFRKQAAGEKVMSESFVLTRDGKRVPVWINTARININGKPHLVGIFRDITERKKAEGELRESELKYRGLFDGAADLIAVVDTRGNFLELNKKFEEESGWKIEEMLGKSVFTSGVVTKASSLRIAFHFPKVFAGMKIPIFEVEGVKKTGGTVPYELRAVPLKEGGKIVAVQAILRNITERKAVEEERRLAGNALEESRLRYKTIYESSKDAIMLLTPEKGFLSGNPATIKLFACKDEAEFTSCGPADLSPEFQPDGRLSTEKAQEMMKIALEKGSHFFEWKHKRINGEEFFATVLLVRMEIEEKELLQATVRDISEQKKMEEDIHRKIADLERFNKLAVGRELKMVELKDRVKELEDKLQNKG
ncbi:MAG: PAS domain S-box protein, partial [Candidatus Omnitrophica bacterium]|nr:PAS domain S-box protein [Candidatus Omnitrophota bacterium]